MKYRTDLALESQEMLERARKKTAGAAGGYVSRKIQKDEDITVTEIIIESPEGEKALGKPKGTYVTIESEAVLREKDGIKERTSRALADELTKMIPFSYSLKVLVVGLGKTRDLVSDSLGPHTVDKVRITAHLFKMFDADGDWEMANVSGFNPSVTGVTGMETADLIEKAVSLVKPDVTVIIDSLAARDLKRLSTTIQICDTGIEPGAGMGNRRKAISRETPRLQGSSHRSPYCHRFPDADSRSVRDNSFLGRRSHRKIY